MIPFVLVYIHSNGFKISKVNLSVDLIKFKLIQSVASYLNGNP